MTDASAAAVLRRWLLETGRQHINTVVSPMKVKAAIERAIEVLTRLDEGLSCPICGHTVLE